MFYSGLGSGLLAFIALDSRVTDDTPDEGFPTVGIHPYDWAGRQGILSVRSEETVGVVFWLVLVQS